MKKRLCALIAALMLMSIPTFAFADVEMSSVDGKELSAPVVEDPVTLDCREFSYTFDNLSENDATVVKTEDNLDRIEYQVYNKADPSVVDTIGVDFNSDDASMMSARATNTRSTFFYRYKTIKNPKTNKVMVDLQYQVRVDLYESGSFRSFYGADSPNLLIRSSITSMELVNVAKGIKSATGKYPTTSLTFNYSANLRTVGTVSTTASANLPGAGFSVTTGSNTYYYRIVADTGTINLY